MKIVFISNYFTHHQKPLSDALAEHCDYTFVSTTEMTAERKNMGWGAEADPAYVRSYLKEPEAVSEIIKQADIVITGSAPEIIVQACLRRKQPVLRYSERPLKKGIEPLKFLPRFMKWHCQNPPWCIVYMLCSSAFTAGDYAKFGLFRGKTFRWGYFPQVKKYENVHAMVDGKEKNTILWAGRFLEWKHPDDAIRVAERLKSEGVNFRLNLIGSGPMEETMNRMIQEAGLQDCVRLLGTMRPEEVRSHMERAGIFLMTSDRREGWGAVVNEAMNSGCGVVVSDAIGSAGYLIRDGENGCVYRSGNVDALYEKVKMLLDDPEKTCSMGLEAYRTITELWNGEVAAQRVITLAQKILDGEKNLNLFPDGPGSPDPTR